MRAGGEAALLALAWSRGDDPYRLYNGLDAAYRPLAHRHPCPACWALTQSLEPCSLCGWRGYVELPIDEPGEPLPPPHPRRLRNFVYGVSIAMEERAARRTISGVS